MYDVAFVSCRLTIDMNLRISLDLFLKYKYLHECYEVLEHLFLLNYMVPKCICNLPCCQLYQLSKPFVSKMLTGQALVH